jgi:hypothetical protein
MYLFSESHPYLERTLWNTEPDSVICQRRPARRVSMMDLEISHLFSHRVQEKQISLAIAYPLKFYYTSDILNSFKIPSPIERGDEEMLRIYQLGLPFDSDYSDVYLRARFIGSVHFALRFLLWIIILIVHFVSYFWFIFTPLLLQIAYHFSILA